jgi:hypothetical protein
MARFFCAYCGRLCTASKATLADDRGLIDCEYSCYIKASTFERIYSDESIMRGEVKTDLVLWLRKQKR